MANMGSARRCCQSRHRQLLLSTEQGVGGIAVRGCFFPVRLDALGNRVETRFDRDGRPREVTRVEKALVPGAVLGGAEVLPEERFTTRYVWDALGRLMLSDPALGGCPPLTG